MEIRCKSYWNYKIKYVIASLVYDKMLPEHIQELSESYLLY